MNNEGFNTLEYRGMEAALSTGMGLEPASRARLLNGYLGFGALDRFSMSRLRGCICLLVVCFLTGGEGNAADWDVRLAGLFSGRLREIERETRELEPQLTGLPRIPIDDQGGTGGYASLHVEAEMSGDERSVVEVIFPEPAMVDEVALVPSRRYDASGLDSQYGMPDRFTVELIDAEGGVLSVIAREQNARVNPVRRGHPFVYHVWPPVEAAGLRISAELLGPGSAGEGRFVHAWAELFAFEGARNVARGGEVKSIGGMSPRSPWRWQPEFLVDGQTPLGLPEIPEAEHRNIGWISEGRSTATEPAVLTVDMGESVLIDAVRLIPARKPTSDLPSGFGFPAKLSITVSDSKQPDSGTVVAEWVSRNPGHNPVLISFAEVKGRYVIIAATKLWKEFDSYPAFFALSEVEVLSEGENLAEGRVVRSSDGMLNMVAPGGRFWSSAALNDGFGPDGKLVPAGEWLDQLDRRLRLETRHHELKAEAERLVAGWRRTGQTGMVLFGLAGAFLLIFLPIRSRMHANRELVKVRERIAGDLHDEVGSNLGSIQMFADLLVGRSGPSEELKRIQRIAAETVSAVRDIVWLLRPEGDHRIATVEHLRETSSIMLEALEWDFTANEEAWQVELREEANRHLFLYFREALHNILRHSKAAKVEIRAESAEESFSLMIGDDGAGIDPERLERPATLRALRQRSDALGAVLDVESRPGEGTRLKLTIPLGKKSVRKSRVSPAPAENA